MKHSNRIDGTIKPIVNTLERICAKGYSPNNVFDDWLDLMTHAFIREEPEYMNIVRKYRNEGEHGQRELDYMAQALAQLLQATQETNSDVLGDIYMQWNLAHHRAGQFFTPDTLAQCMAKMVLGDSPKGRIGDPACGSGTTLVECIKSMTNADIDESYFVAQDIDATCAKMTALNLLFFNVNATVIQGDTLAMECRAGFFTKRSYMGGTIRRMTLQEVAHMDEANVFNRPVIQRQPQVLSIASPKRPLSQIVGIKVEQLDIF